MLSIEEGKELEKEFARKKGLDIKETINFQKVRVKPFIQSVGYKIGRRLLFLAVWIISVVYLTLRIAYYTSTGQGANRLVKSIMLVLFISIFLVINVKRSKPVPVSIVFTDTNIIIRSKGHKYAPRVYVDGVFNFSYNDIEEITYDKDEKELIICGELLQEWYNCNEGSVNEILESRGMKKDKLILAIEGNCEVDMHHIFSKYTDNFRYVR